MKALVMQPSIKSITDNEILQYIEHVIVSCLIVNVAG